MSKPLIDATRRRMPTLYQNQFDHNVITKELEQAWVDEDAPRVPAVPYPYEFETYSVVWYWSHDGKWYPALVLGPAKDTPDQLTKKKRQGKENLSPEATQDTEDVEHKI